MGRERTAAVVGYAVIGSGHSIVSCISTREVCVHEDMATYTNTTSRYQVVGNARDVISEHATLLGAHMAAAGMGKHEGWWSVIHTVPPGCTVELCPPVTTVAERWGAVSFA